MIKIGITHGDINGTGYEIIFRCFENEEMLSLCTPVIYGSPKAATFHRKSIDNQTNFIVRANVSEIRDHSVNMVNCFGEDELKIEFGTATEDKDKIAQVSLDKALKDVQQENVDILVTAPVTFSDGTSQVDYISQKINGSNEPQTILIADRLRIASVTENIALQQVSKYITKELISQKIQTLRSVLQRDFCIENPRIAIIALNPKEGESSFAGTEEKEIISPLVQEMFNAGTLCFGPYSAEYIFSDNNYDHFDAVLTMYYDQAMVPFKAITHREGYRYISGLPFIVTSPAHDAQYEIAGKGIASVDAFRNAIYAAIDAYRNRKQYDAIHAHPLQKQFHDKRDDSDKLKLDQVSEEDDTEVTMI